MNKIIKEFIENNVDLLDSNPQEFFLRTWEQNIPREEVAFMSALLSDAGIDGSDIAEWRTDALFQIIDTQLSMWHLSTGGVSSLPLYDFISAFLDNCVGFAENYVLLFMLKNKDRWAQWVKFTKDMKNNVTIIERI